jgi:hypothetical protein
MILCNTFRKKKRGQNFFWVFLSFSGIFLLYIKYICFCIITITILKYVWFRYHAVPFFL